MKIIIATTDFSKCAQNASEYAFDMACTIGANLLIFHAISLPVGYSEVPLEMNVTELEQLAVKQLEAVKTNLAARKPNAGCQTGIRAEARVGSFHEELRAISA